MQEILAATVSSAALLLGSLQAEAAKPQPRGLIAFIVKQVRPATILPTSDVGIYDPACRDPIDPTDSNAPVCISFGL